MDAATRDKLVDALIDAPAGAAFVTRLEAVVRTDAAWFDSPDLVGDYVGRTVSGSGWR
jgi:hypothetical protein